MLPLLTALMILSQPASPAEISTLRGKTTVFSTVGQSEWCQPGNVWLDLRTGKYAFTARAPRRVCNDNQMERPVRRGRLERTSLSTIRGAFQRVRAEGLDACRDGSEPQQIMFSNGGIRILALTSGTVTTTAPGDLSCWSEAAHQLHRALDGAFPSPR